MNQAPTRTKSRQEINPDKKEIDTRRNPMYNKVGLMNQTPTRNKPIQEINQDKK